MATEIIASGTTTANSADRTVAAGATETIIFRSAASNAAQCVIEVKGSDSAYYAVGKLGDDGRVKQIDGPLTYRVRRGAGAGASAVDVEA
jgi:hypothetical protein